MIDIRSGDCLSVMASMDENSVDAIVTDPPYGLQFMGKEWDKLWRNQTEADVAYVERTAGELSSRARKLPDYAKTDPQQMQEWFRGFAVAALRVLKPGGHMVAFGAPKNYHRLACAIEDAGFEIRDSLMWVFGSGFPKSHNAGNGWGTALKPAYEPIVLARKPLIGTVAENVLAWGTGAINVDACRIGTEVLPAQKAGQAKLGTFERYDMVTPERTGRWPANLVHDGSDEVLAAFPETSSGNRKAGEYGLMGYHGADAKPMPGVEGDSGSAARFFYCAKAGKADRAGSKHPTVKPIALMRWLCRLITPPGGTILDPFAGTGTTGAAAIEEGFDAILIEREAEYLADINRRFGVFDLAAELG